MSKQKTGTEETQDELDLGTTSPKVNCSKCHEEKNQGEYPRDKSRKSGYASQCKSCRRQYRKDNASALLESRRKYRSRPENRYKTYKESAIYRGYQWLLSNSEFMVHWKSPCTWCDAPIETIGLDRVDPSLPYQADNIESCCGNCNRMKSDLTADEFRAHIGAIHKHSIDTGEQEEGESNDQ